jgi:hypothetical protein
MGAEGRASEKGRLVMTPDNEEVLAMFRKYFSERPAVGADICSAEQAATFARMMSEITGTPLSELTIAKIKAFKRKLRDGARPDPRWSELTKRERSMELHRMFLAIEFFLSFRRDMLEKHRRAA